jgi:soluble lytic murein transglycosylase-like protein
MIRTLILAWAALFFLVSPAHASDADAAVSVLCPKHAELAPMIETSAHKHGIDPVLLTSMVFSESSCNPNAVGSHGEIGLGQIMPTGPAANGLSRAQLRDPSTNLDTTARWMAICRIQCGGDLGLALGAYNSGGCVRSKYAKRVLDLVKRVWREFAKMAKKEG